MLTGPTSGLGRFAIFPREQEENGPARGGGALASTLLWAAVLSGAIDDRIAAAQAPVVPATPYYALPPASVAPTPGSPVQQQVLENYRTQLLQTRRDLLLQNPAGLGPDQLEIGRRLNRLDAITAGPAPPAALGGNTAPDLGAVPSGPFNAAPAPAFPAH